MILYIRSIKLGIWLLLISNIGLSQTIINAERLMGGKDSTIFSLAFSYNGTGGNAITNRVDIAPAIVLVREKSNLMLFGGYSLLSQSNDKILNTGFGHIRHTLRINKRFGTFEFYQRQFNEVLLLTRREVIGAGLTYKIVNSDSLKLDLNAGVMREVEILKEASLLPDELSETKYLRLSIVNSFSWYIGKLIRINNVIYYQPYIGDFADFRLLDDFNLIVALDNHIEFISSFTFRYDSQPPSALKSTDNSIAFGINLKF
jgi:hypothetical protein